MFKPLKRILQVGFPLLASQLSHYLLNVADMAMVGRLSSSDLAAIGIGGLFTSVLFTLIWPISVGTQVVASRRYGRQEAGLSTAEDTAEVLNTGLLISLGIGLLAWILSFSARPVLSIILEDRGLIERSMEYIGVFRWGYLVAAPAMAYTGFCSSVQKTGISMAATLISNLTNILFNYLLIFGKWGLPRLELRGAAWGSVLAMGLSSLIYLVFVVSNRDLKKYPLHRFRFPDPVLAGKILSHMIPPMVQNGIALSIFLLYEGMIGNLGTIYLAVTHVIFALFRINKAVVGGFARGAAILVGNALGVNDMERAALVIRRMQQMALVLGLVIFSMVMLFPAAIFRLFSPDPLALPIAVDALRFFALYVFAETLGFSLEIIFQSNGWGSYVLFSEFTTNILFILLFTWFFAVFRMGGVSAAWWGFALYQLGHALILCLGWLSGSWKKALGKELH